MIYVVFKGESGWILFVLFGFLVGYVFSFFVSLGLFNMIFGMFFVGGMYFVVFVFVMINVGCVFFSIKVIWLVG